jgi:hypothetical protein
VVKHIGELGLQRTTKKYSAEGEWSVALANVFGPGGARLAAGRTNRTEHEGTAARGKTAARGAQQYPKKVRRRQWRAGPERGRKYRAFEDAPDEGADAVQMHEPTKGLDMKWRLKQTRSWTRAARQKTAQSSWGRTRWA